MSIQGFPNDTKIGIFGTKICIPSGNPARKKREKSCLTKNLDLLPMYEIFLQNRLFEIWFPVESRRQNCFRHLAALSKGWITSAASRYPLLESFSRQTWSFKLFQRRTTIFPRNVLESASVLLSVSEVLNCPILKSPRSVISSSEFWNWLKNRPRVQVDCLLCRYV
jgi:hypothetical protein